MQAQGETMTNPGDVLGKRVRITNPSHPESTCWEGRVVGYSDHPTYDLEREDGSRVSVCADFDVEVLPECAHDWRVNPAVILAANPHGWEAVCILCQAREFRGVIAPQYVVDPRDPRTWPRIH
jgi:hypothetical protein